MKNLFTKVLYSALFIHFFLVAASLLPSNPVKSLFSQELTAYMTPLFGQRWNLFAPNPVRSNLRLLYRFVIHKNGLTDTTEWIDVSASLLAQKRTSFWSAPQRMFKYITNNCRGIIARVTNREQYKRVRNVYYFSGNGQSTSHINLVAYSHYEFSLCKYKNSHPDSLEAQYQIRQFKFPSFRHRMEPADQQNSTLLTVISAYFSIKQSLN